MTLICSGKTLIAVTNDVIRLPLLLLAILRVRRGGVPVNRNRRHSIARLVPISDDVDVSIDDDDDDDEVKYIISLGNVVVAPCNNIK